MTRENSNKLKKWARETGTTIKEQFELLLIVYEDLKEKEPIKGSNIWLRKSDR